MKVLNFKRFDYIGFFRDHYAVLINVERIFHKPFVYNVHHPDS